MTFGLVLGGLDLIDTDETYTIETLAEGTDFGNPQPVEVAIRHLLQDGSIVEHERDDNREISLRVIIGGSDGVSLAEGEAALLAELYKRNTLTLTPPDGFGAPTVFDVLTSSLARITDDLAEVLLGERHFSIRLVCFPYGRSAVEVLTPALGGTVGGSPATITNVDTCSSTTGWTGAANANNGSNPPGSTVGSMSTTSAGGAVIQSARPVDPVLYPPPHWVDQALTRAGSISTSTTPYIVVDWKVAVGTSVYLFNAVGDGVGLAKVMETTSPTAGYTRTFFKVGAGVTSISTLAIGVVTYTGGPYPIITRTLSIDLIARSDGLPLLGTARQLIRTLAVQGSARTQATLAVEHETNALGDVLVYTFPDDGRGYTPPLRGFRTAGGTFTADTALVSGAYDMLDTLLVFDVPAATLPPGAFGLVARIRGSGTNVTTLLCTARTRINSVDVGPVVSWSVPVSVTTAWVMMPLGPQVSLPTVDLGSAGSATVRVTVVDNDTSGIDIDLDEAWLLNLDVGALTMVSCGTASPTSGGSSKRLFILPATSDVPRPRVLRGHAVDLSDAFNADAMSRARHQFVPPSMSVLSVTSNTIDAAVSLRHYPRWHSHAVS